MHAITKLLLDEIQPPLGISILIEYNCIYVLVLMLDLIGQTDHGQASTIKPAFGVHGLTACASNL